MRLRNVFAAAVVIASSAPACTEDPPTTTSSTTSGQGGGGSGASGGAPGTGGDGGAIGGAGGGAGGSGGTPGDTCGIGSSGSGGLTGGRLRVVAANLTSGNQQSYDQQHGVRILQGLDADVVLLQEMNFGNNSEVAMASLVDDICDGDCKYVRGPDAEIPNGVLTRLPILECGSWPDPQVSNRDFVWARIDVPGDADLWAISVHLLSSSAQNRDLEAAAILAHIAGNVPSQDLIVLGGDLNTDNRTEAGVVTLSSLFDTSAPHPADHLGTEMTNAPRSKPYDWILADSQLEALEIPVVIGLSMFAAGAVIDTRVYTPLTEIAPALIDDSGAPSMQHMAVVKDYQLD